MAKQIGLLPKGGGPPLPLTSVDVTGKVGEALCELTVRQTFENKESKPLEVIYTFPVDASSVVTGIMVRTRVATIEMRLECWSSAWLPRRERDASCLDPNVYAPDCRPTAILGLTKLIRST